LREDLGAELTPEAEAGIRRRFSEMQGPMLGLLGKQAEMVLAQSRHELDREQFKYDKWYKSQMLKAAQLKAQNEGSKAANEKLDDLRKSAINSYLQRKSTLEDMNREFDISKGGLFLPDVLSSANDVKQAQNSIASNIADYAIQFDDSNVPDKYRKLMNEYKKYKGLGNEEKQLQAATKLVNAVLSSEDGPTSLLQNLDYGSWWPFAGSDQPEKTQYGSHLFGAYQALTRYQDAATLKNADHEEIARNADKVFSDVGTTTTASQESQSAPAPKKNELSSPDVIKKATELEKQLGLKRPPSPNFNDWIGGGPTWDRVEAYRAARKLILDKAKGENVSDDELGRLIAISTYGAESISAQTGAAPFAPSSAMPKAPADKESVNKILSQWDVPKISTFSGRTANPAINKSNEKLISSLKKLAGLNAAGYPVDADEMKRVSDIIKKLKSDSKFSSDDKALLSEAKNILKRYGIE